MLRQQQHLPPLLGNVWLPRKCVSPLKKLLFLLPQWGWALKRLWHAANILFCRSRPTYGRPATHGYVVTYWECVVPKKMRIPPAKTAVFAVLVEMGSKATNNRLSISYFADPGPPAATLPPTDRLLPHGNVWLPRKCVYPQQKLLFLLF